MAEVPVANPSMPSVILALTGWQRAPLPLSGPPWECLLTCQGGPDNGRGARCQPVNAIRNIGAVRNSCYDENDNGYIDEPCVLPVVGTNPRKKLCIIQFIVLVKRYRGFCGFHFLR